MKKFFLIFLSILLVLLLIRFFRGDKKEQGPDMSKKPMPMKVSGMLIKAENFSEVLQASGTIVPQEEVELHPEVSGRIIRLTIKEGSVVEKGQLLLKINDADLQAQAGKQKSQMKLLNDKLARQKKLLELKAISQEEMESFQNQVDALKADMSVTQSDILKTEIRAPFSGHIGLKYVSEGAYISPSTKIATLVQDNPVKIDMSIPEKYISQISPGDMISFTTEGMDSAATGKIYAIESHIDPGTRTIGVRALAPNTHGRFHAGQFARVRLKLKEIPQAILIPTETLIPELKGQKVVVSDHGKARFQPVETGTRTDTRVLIRKGLKPGDTLVITGMLQVKNGSPLKFIKVQP